MSLAGLTWLRPWWLLALLPLGLLLWRLWRASDQSEAVWRRLVDAHLLAHLLVFSNPWARRSGLTLLAGALLVAVLALAGPALKQPPEPAYRRDVTRLLVLDLSPGMTAQLEQVKPKILALLRAWPDGQTALLVYSGEPYLVVPPTTDTGTIALFVPDLAVDAMPAPGNRPERALRMAAALLARNAAQQRELIWITTGAAGAELPLAELAGVRLSILQTVAVEDPALAAAAQRSGGVLLRLRADDGDVRQLLGSTEARSGWIDGTGKAGDDAGDLGYWLLLPLLPLAALVFRRGLLALLLGPLLWGGLLTPQPVAAMELPLAAIWADYQAWRLLEAGQPQAAAERFADPRWRATAHYRAAQFEQSASLLASASDADAHYNRGNALARQGKLVEALAAYDAALALRANDADARYNRDLVQELLKQPPEAPKGAASGKPPPPGGKPPAAGQAPPAPGPAQSQSDTAEREAARVAEQWLRGIPDQPGNLLKRKLLAEQRRRQAGAAARPW